MQIDIERLAVRYDGRRVIDDLSLTIPSGTFFTLLGPSGCGKTTLLRAIAGFAAIEAGQLRFGPSDVTRVPAHKRNIGMVFQDYALFPDKTVFDNVAYGLRARNIIASEITRRVTEALESVDLGSFAKRRPAELSGGQRQRVALVRALAIEPDVLLMDEPLSNLDAKLRHSVRETIVTLQRRAKTTTIFVTHDQEEALAMSDLIGVMHAGRLEQVGRPRDIYRLPMTGYVADFVGGANLFDVEAPAHADVTSALTVMFCGQPLTGHAPAPLPAGPAKIAVRPEDIALELEREPSKQQSPLKGAIAHRQYLGARTTYGVKLDTGPLLRVDCAGADHDRFAIADRVLVTFDPARTLVLAS